MTITLDTDNEEIKALIINHSYIGCYKKLKSNKSFVDGLSKVLALLRAVEQLSELSHYGALHFEALKHQYSGMYSVRIAYKLPWRMILRDNGDSVSVCIVDINNHYDSN